jgi:hypothetical protein
MLPWDSSAHTAREQGQDEMFQKSSEAVVVWEFPGKVEPSNMTETIF